uniref:PRISE-like Rossmann-fold domain-containing protein n=1 Tax=Bionectria ochroleuca TaxID=29856 RepID=A0A8H7N4H5_BIOOC
MTTTDESYQALVFGASGISGWAITRAAVLSETPYAFSKVIALTNRPLSLKSSAWPDDPKLELKHGLDLTRGPGPVRDYLSQIGGIEKTTHVYFTAYVHGAFGNIDSDARTRVNVEILRNAVLAWYGTEFSHILKPKAPFQETAPRIPKPYSDHCFYYPQVDLLEELSNGKDWSYANIIPDSIIGLVPNGNPMTIAHPIGLYLALWKSFRHTEPVPFPGTRTSYHTLHTDTSQDILGDFTIFLSMRGESSSGKSFNIADNDGVSWESTWGGICSYFGLKGVEPMDNTSSLQGEAWVTSIKSQWAEWEADHALKKGTVEAAPWEFFTIIV